MRRSVVGILAALGLAAAPAHADVPVTLRGSPQSMVRQNEVAKGLGLPFAETPADVRALEAEGALVPLEGNADYEVADFVRHPHARPEMRTFIERLAAQYRAATGEKLVVTSLTRPASRQPGNSHALSVHPTGMAVDLRVSRQAASREWLEGALLSLEEQGLLDITRERHPPHYHVALFPEAYMAHVARLEAREAERAAAAARMPQVAASFVPAQREEEPRKGSPWAVAALVALGAGAALRGQRRKRQVD